MNVNFAFRVEVEGMLVCHCFAVRATEIRSAIAGGARSRHEITRACRAGGSCGGCRPVIEELLEAHAHEPRACVPAAEVCEQEQTALHA
jgi:NAD(P)H-nitrite reductase large subunit